MLCRTCESVKSFVCFFLFYYYFLLSALYANWYLINFICHHVVSRFFFSFYSFDDAREIKPSFKPKDIHNTHTRAHAWLFFVAVFFVEAAFPHEQVDERLVSGAFGVHLLEQDDSLERSLACLLVHVADQVKSIIFGDLYCCEYTLSMCIQLLLIQVTFNSLVCSFWSLCCR